MVSSMTIRDNIERERREAEKALKESKERAAREEKKNIETWNAAALDALVKLGIGRRSLKLVSSDPVGKTTPSRPYYKPSSSTRLVRVVQFSCSELLPGEILKVDVYEEIGTSGAKQRYMLTYIFVTKGSREIEIHTLRGLEPFLR
jgi:hypothetical protein